MPLDCARYAAPRPLKPSELSVVHLFGGRTPRIESVRVEGDGSARAVLGAKDSHRHLVLARAHRADAWCVLTDREATHGERAPVPLSVLDEHDAAVYQAALAAALPVLGKAKQDVLRSLVDELQSAPPVAAELHLHANVDSSRPKRVAAADFARDIVVRRGADAVEVAVRTGSPRTVDVPVAHPRPGFADTVAVDDVIAVLVLDTTDYAQLHQEGDACSRSLTADWPVDLQSCQHKVQASLLAPAPYLGAVKEAVRVRAKQLGLPHVMFSTSQQNGTRVTAYLSGKPFGDLAARAKPTMTLLGAAQRLLRARLL